MTLVSVNLTILTSDEPMVLEDTDTLVLASGHKAQDRLEAALEDYAGELHIIGDCLAPRTAEEAVYEGLKVGRQI